MSSKEVDDNDDDSNSDNEEDEDEDVDVEGIGCSMLKNMSTAKGSSRLSSIKTAKKHFKDFCMAEKKENHLNFDVFKAMGSEETWAVIGRFASYLLGKRNGERVHFTAAKVVKGILGCIRGEINSVCGESYLSKYFC